MRNILVILALIIITVPAFAQRGPHRGPRGPHRGPVRHVNCQVVMVDRYHRVIQRFFAQADWRTGMCRDGLRSCHHALQRRHVYGGRCVQVR